jgi:ABC-type spermidine/putrescine transport system permease subunit I
MWVIKVIAWGLAGAATGAGVVGVVGGGAAVFVAAIVTRLFGMGDPTRYAAAVILVMAACVGACMGAWSGVQEALRREDVRRHGPPDSGPTLEWRGPH